MRTIRLKSIITSLAVSGILVGIPSAALAKDTKSAKAKVGRAEADKIVLAKVPDGKVKEAELEKEDGKLVWSFDLSTPGTKDITEVLVDAKTGAVVSVEKESAESELKERKAEEKEKEDKHGKMHDEDDD